MLHCLDRIMVQVREPVLLQLNFMLCFHATEVITVRSLVMILKAIPIIISQTWNLIFIEKKLVTLSVLNHHVLIIHKTITVKPLYTWYALKRTFLYSGHLFQESVVYVIGKCHCTLFIWKKLSIEQLWKFYNILKVESL